ncbi:MAG TPA: hypothetical protein VJV79_23280 [Polyangiaceae bacterium]|nr:hypothetical protein [Polyangiaceae bacterium]
MKTGWLTLGITFVAAAGLTVALLQCTPARAASVFTVSARNCLASGGGISCGVPGGSAVYYAGGFDHAWYNYKTTGASTLVTTSLYKQDAYTGAIRTDYVAEYDGPGFHDRKVVASQVNLALDVWDYYFADIVGPGTYLGTRGNTFGIAAVTKN